MLYWKYEENRQYDWFSSLMDGYSQSLSNMNARFSFLLTDSSISTSTSTKSRSSWWTWQWGTASEAYESVAPPHCSAFQTRLYVLTQDGFLSSQFTIQWIIWLSSLIWCTFAVARSWVISRQYHMYANWRGYKHLRPLTSNFGDHPLLSPQCLRPYCCLYEHSSINERM